MNRRRFLQSIAAVFTVPSGSIFSLQPAAATAASSAVAVPAQARFWAIYISAMHGECTPQTLQNMLHIPEIDAKRYIGQLLTDGVIKPTPVLQQAMTEMVKPREDGLLDKVKKRLEKKQQAGKAEAVKAELSVSDDLNETQEPETDRVSDEVAAEELAEVEASELELEAAEDIDVVAETTEAQEAR